VFVDKKEMKDSWKSTWKKLMNERMNGIIEYQLELKKDQQIASGLITATHYLLLQ